MDGYYELRSGIVPFFLRSAKKHPLLLFFAMAYLWSWTTWLVVPRIVRPRAPAGEFGAFDIILIVAGACGPSVSALITQWLACRNLRLAPLWTGRRTLAGMVSGLAILFLIVVVAPALAFAKAPWSSLHWSILAHWSSYAVNYSTFVGGPVNEEPGWRGFALPRLQSRFGPFAGSIVLAIFWAGWHTPLFFIPGWITATPWEFLLILIGISFVFTLAANLSRYSLIVAILLHAFFNTSSGLLGGIMQGVPARNHDNLIYAAVVFLLGTAIGLVLLHPIFRSSLSAIQPSSGRTSTTDHVPM